MITVKSHTRRKSIVKFTEMVPGKLYRFIYSCSGAIVTGIAGRNSDKEISLIVLKVDRGRGVCSDKVGDVWDTTSTMRVDRDAKMELADDITAIISN
jgi:hypothetical protein